MKVAFLCLLSVLSGSFPAYAQSVDKNYLLGRFEPRDDLRFVKPSDHHTEGAARSQFLRRETYEAFIQMAEAAQKDGVTLTIISSTRNFYQQKGIWERKWDAESSISDEAERARKILLYSSMPGTSRHHWGTDIDLNNLNNEYFESGEGLKIYSWLTSHAHEFGFCQPYTAKRDGRTGYEEEKWHWSFTPLANEFLGLYKTMINVTDIKDFQGSQTAQRIDVIRNYVEGVACK